MSYICDKAFSDFSHRCFSEGKSKRPLGLKRRSRLKPATAIWNRRGRKGTQSSRENAHEKGSEKPAKSSDATAQSDNLLSEAPPDEANKRQSLQPVAVTTSDGEIVIENPISETPMIAELTMQEGQSLEDMSRSLGISLEKLVAANGGSKEVTSETKLRFQVPTPEDPNELANLLTVQSVGADKGQAFAQPGNGMHWAVSNPENTFASAARYWAPWLLAGGVIAAVTYVVRRGRSLRVSSATSLQERARKRRAQLGSSSGAALKRSAELEQSNEDRRESGKHASTSAVQPIPSLQGTPFPPLAGPGGSRRRADLRKSANKHTSPVMPSWVDHQRVWVCMQQGNTSCTFKFQPRLPNEASWLVYENSEDAEMFRAWSRLHRAPYERGQSTVVKVVGMPPLQAVEMAASQDCGIAFVSISSVKADASMQEADMWAELMTVATHYTRRPFHNEQMSVQQILDVLHAKQKRPARPTFKDTQAASQATGLLNGKKVNRLTAEPRAHQAISPSSSSRGRQNGSVVEAEFQDSQPHTHRSLDKEAEDTSQSDSFRNNYSALRHRAERLAAQGSLDTSLQTVVAELPDDEAGQEKMLREMKQSDSDTWRQFQAIGRTSRDSSSSTPFESAAAAVKHMRASRDGGGKTSAGQSSRPSGGAGNGGPKARFQRAFRDKPKKGSQSEGSTDTADDGRNSSSEASSGGNSDKARRAEEAINRVLHEYTSSNGSGRKQREPQMPAESSKPSSGIKGWSKCQTDTATSPGIRSWSKSKAESTKNKAEDRNQASIKDSTPGIQGWARPSSETSESLSQGNSQADINGGVPNGQKEFQSVGQTEDDPAKWTFYGSKDAGQGSKSRSGSSGFSSFSSKINQRLGDKSPSPTGRSASEKKAALFELRAKAKSKATKSDTPATPNDFNRIFDEASRRAQDREVIDVPPESRAEQSETTQDPDSSTIPSYLKQAATDAFQSALDPMVIEPPKKLRSEAWRSEDMLHFPTFRDNTGEFYMAMDIAGVEGFQDPHFIGFADQDDARQYLYYRRMLGDQSCYTVTSATPSDVAEVTGSAEELGVTVFKPGCLPVSTWATEKLPLEDSDRELLLLARSVHN